MILNPKSACQGVNSLVLLSFRKGFRTIIQLLINIVRIITIKIPKKICDKSLLFKCKLFLYNTNEIVIPICHNRKITLQLKLIIENVLSDVFMVILLLSD